MYKVLIHICQPAQLITGLCALKEQHKNDQVNAVLLFYHPSLGQSEKVEIQECITTLVADDRLFSAVHVCATSDEVEQIIGLYPKQTFNRIYYSHDIGNFSRKLFAYFDHARRISFGDGPGLIGRREDLLAHRHIYVSAYEEILPHHASLVLPVAYSDDFFEMVSYSICTRKVLMDVVYSLVERSSKLQKYIEKVVADYADSKIYVLLMENYIEAGYLSRETCIPMYANIIKEHVLPGSTVLLKEHPMVKHAYSEDIKNILGEEYVFVTLDRSFHRYPIELWRELCERATIISASCPVLFLKYVWGTEVVNPFINGFIEEWFPEEAWLFLKTVSSEYIQGAKEALDGWTGKSVLWKGKGREIYKTLKRTKESELVVSEADFMNEPKDVVVVHLQDKKKPYVTSVLPLLRSSYVEYEVNDIENLEIHHLEKIRAFDPKVVVVLDCFGPAKELAIRLRDENIVTIEFSDGQLEWCCTWENKNMYAQPQYQPILTDKFAAMSLPQMRVLESWGNHGKCELVGTPRFDTYADLNPIPHEGWRLLVATPNTVGYDDEQWAIGRRCIEDVIDIVEKNKDWITPIWRLSPKLAEEIGITNTIGDMVPASLPEQLSMVDAVVCMHSTLLLEAMALKLPTAVIDYKNVPRYLQSAWPIYKKEDIETQLQSMKARDPKRMLYQEYITSFHLPYVGEASTRAAKLLDYIVDHISSGKHKRDLPQCILDRERFPSRIVSEKSYDLDALYKDHPVFSNYKGWGVWQGLNYFEQKSSYWQERFHSMENKCARLQNDNAFLQDHVRKIMHIYRAFSRCLELGIKRIALWGTGKHSEDIVELNKKTPFVEIVAAIDIASKKRAVLDVPVITPEETTILYDAVLLSSEPYENILWEKARSLLPDDVPVLGIYKEEHYYVGKQYDATR